ncbi:MAG: efflux RND transporter periplasmic adaptor subunit [Anaerolineales bacterium]|nr:efflux RND transporter periplasmic adaptor subunit [Anaerolineales bacterium]
MMNTISYKFFVVFFLTALVLSACGGEVGETSENTGIPVVIDNFDIIAEGRLVPHQLVQLSFAAGGQVAEVLVSEGDEVETNQVLARLEGSEELQVRLADAELELLSAQRSLSDINENADLETAKAAQALVDTRDALDDAEKDLGNLDVGANPTNIESARATVTLAEDKLDKAKKDYEPYEGRAESDTERANMLLRLTEAQAEYDSAARRLNALLGVGVATDFEWDEANADLALAQAEYASAQRQFEAVKEGPDQDLVADADARLEVAQAEKEAAEIALVNLELRAPIGGRVANLTFKVGEQVAVGQVVLNIADFSQWKVETDNLTEIEVPNVFVGQSVTITPDALPELSLAGTVESISDWFEVKRGDVTYTAFISLEESDTRLRWGMTLVITFKSQ